MTGGDRCRWRDFELPRFPGDWLGLVVDIPAGALPPRPALRVEVCAGRRVRVVGDAGPLLWTHAHSGSEGAWWLHADRERSSPLPAITAPELRKLPHAVPEQAYWSGWARWFARALADSPQTPLRPGTYGLSCGQIGGGGARITPAPSRWHGSRDGWPHLSVGGLDRCLDAPPLGWLSWIGGGGTALRLRRPPAADDSRVRAWRKRARDGTLPPLLLMLVRGSGAWLLLDGHDRLAAALAEGCALPLLYLWSYHREVIPPHPQLPEGGELIVPGTWAWPLPGGGATWRAEVGARLAELGRREDHALMDGWVPYQARERGRQTD